jgi:putative transposase
VPHRITRHTHPKARPETPDEAPAPATGIAYLQLVADAHQQQVAADERIGFHALYATEQQPAPEQGQLSGQLSIDDALHDDALHDDTAPAGAQVREARA